MPTVKQQALLAQVEALLRAEPRVDAAWLAGSLGRGGGDEYSDVDTLVLAKDAGETAAALSERIKAEVDPPLLNIHGWGRVLSVVTEDWQRFDVTVLQGDEIERYDAAKLTLLFNRGTREPPVHPAATYRCAPETLRTLVIEFIRVIGLTPVAMGRKEFELALSGIDILRRSTMDLMLEENGIAPADRGGALHRNNMLTAEQLADFRTIPPQTATQESVLAANAAYARIFLPRAKRLAATIGMEWPERFEQVTRRHLKATLGFALPE
ncbi:MAG: nucleotidyltransferase domain-containing protein [Proteobacteria bacterium]|nr:nucleotidyltransferase domain-containing protein [Pseudomonadota bacterium]